MMDCIIYLLPSNIKQDFDLHNVSLSHPLQNYLPYTSNSHGQYQEGKIIRQQQTEMNPADPPPVGIDQVVAAQMMVLQQMAELVNKMQNQIRQER
jgi:hypothetical protein